MFTCPIKIISNLHEPLITFTLSIQFNCLFTICLWIKLACFTSNYETISYKKIQNENLVRLIYCKSASGIFSHSTSTEINSRAYTKGEIVVKSPSRLTMQQLGKYMIKFFVEFHRFCVIQAFVKLFSTLLYLMKICIGQLQCLFFKEKKDQQNGMH